MRRPHPGRARAAAHTPRARPRDRASPWSRFRRPRRARSPRRVARSPANRRPTRTRPARTQRRPTSRRSPCRTTTPASSSSASTSRIERSHSGGHALRDLGRHGREPADRRPRPRRRRLRHAAHPGRDPLYRWDGTDFTRRAGDPAGDVADLRLSGRGDHASAPPSSGTRRSSASVHRRLGGSRSIRRRRTLDCTNAVADIAPAADAGSTRTR